MVPRPLASSSLLLVCGLLVATGCSSYERKKPVPNRADAATPDASASVDRGGAGGSTGGSGGLESGGTGGNVVPEPSGGDAAASPDAPAVTDAPALEMARTDASALDAALVDGPKGP